MQKTILITGGAGYVGSKLTEYALEHKYRVICMDNLVYGNKSIKKFLKNPNYIFFLNDVRDENILKKIFKNKIDYVVNLASIVGDKQCKTISKSAYDINYNGNKILCSYAISNNVKKYIFASTCSNYGISNPNKFANENSKLNPVSLYAETKIDAESYLSKISDSGMEIFILRFATAFGASLRTRFDLTLNSFTYEALKYSKVEVFAKDSWRPFIHVNDMSILILKIFNYKKNDVSGQIFNAGFTKENFNKIQLVNKIKKQIKNTKILYNHTIDDRRSYRVSFKKLENKFNAKVNYNLDYGIKEIKDLLKRKIITDRDVHENLLDSNCERLLKFYKA
tara:strand:- start:347 stop:1357 length:1011 start_codon:yes stop_codon:yes gene_type:complete